MEPITDKVKDVFSCNKRNVNIIRLGYTILASTAEAGIDKNWCLIHNNLTHNAFINVKYMSNIRDAPDIQYPHFHCNTGVTYTNNIGELPGYSNTVWYNPEGISNILSLVLLQK